MTELTLLGHDLPAQKAADDDVFADPGDSLLLQLGDGDALVADVRLAQQNVLIFKFLKRALNDFVNDGLGFAGRSRCFGGFSGQPAEHTAGEIRVGDETQVGGGNLKRNFVGKFAESVRSRAFLGFGVDLDHDADASVCMGVEFDVAVRCCE